MSATQNTMTITTNATDRATLMAEAELINTRTKMNGGRMSDADLWRMTDIVANLKTLEQNDRIGDAILAAMTGQQAEQAAQAASANYLSQFPAMQTYSNAGIGANLAKFDGPNDPKLAGWKAAR